MRSSALRSDADAPRVAEQLLGSPVVAFKRCSGSGNNRLYRVHTASNSFALKSYGRAQDGRQRLRSEFGALSFLSRHGMTGLTPRAIAADFDAGFACYEWIDGLPVLQHDTADIDAVLELLERAHNARDAVEAESLPPAREAVVCGVELLAQIRRRLARLQATAPPCAELTQFLSAEFAPCHATYQAALTAAPATLSGELQRAEQTLSPSDVSFHNALRRPDGALVFLDFEYFGWDDPVKLVSDFLWHPAMTLSNAQKARFCTGARRIYGPGDGAFDARLRMYFPLFGLRWCLIVLNEFLTDHWNRRRFSGDERNRRDVKTIQLAKARRLLAEIDAKTPEGL